MSALFSHGWLIDTAAAVTLLIALALVLRGPVARAFGPTFAYALWLLPLARAVLPGITLTVEAPASPAAAIPLALAAPPPPPAAATFDWALMLLLMWLTGALIVGGHALLAYVRLRRAIAADASLIDIRGRIAIVQSDAVDGPVALGLFRPLVVLPRDFDAVFTSVQQRQVIAHELEHHRGGDLAINLAAFALLALNWFNPIAWAGWRAFRQDQEAACDARTLDRLGARTGADRATYGRAIAVAVAGPVFRPAPAFALSMGEKSALIHRLRSLTMTDITPRRRWLGRTTLTAAALIALPLTASISYAVVQADPAPPAPPAAPVVPGAPPAPLPPLSPEIDMTAGPGEYVRRIEHNGRTIILRTNRELSDAEVESMVAEAETNRAATETEIAGNRSAAAAEAEANADGRRREIHRIVIRNHGRTDGQSDAVMSVPPVPPVPPAPPVYGARRETTYSFRYGGHASDSSSRHLCDNDPAAARLERTTGTGADQHTLRIVRCGGGEDTPSRLMTMRLARRSLAAMNTEQLPAAARRSALAELDGLIAELERETGN